MTTTQPDADGEVEDDPYALPPSTSARLRQPPLLPAPPAVPPPSSPTSSPSPRKATKRGAPDIWLRF